MTLEDLNLTLRTLQNANVRMLIAGGLAVLAHGHSRVTHDLDIVLALDSENAKRAMDALSGLGFRPRLPVTAEEFYDEATRKMWIEKKNLRVFPLANEAMNGFVVDIFAEEPFDFEEEWLKAARINLPGFPAELPFVSKTTLISMKQKAGRPIDLDDVKHLQHTP
jgi:hypothetical protein